MTGKNYNYFNIGYVLTQYFLKEMLRIHVAINLSLFFLYLHVLEPGGWKEKYKLSFPGPCSSTLSIALIKSNFKNHLNKKATI